MAAMLPIVGFVGFTTVAALVGIVGFATVTGGGEFPLGGLLGGVVVIMSDFLFLVVWSVDCAQDPTPLFTGVLTVLDIQFLCSLECQLCLISNSLLLFMYTQLSTAVGFSLVSQPSLPPALGPANEADVTSSSLLLAMLLQLGLCWEVYCTCRCVPLYFLLLQEEQGSISIVSLGWAHNQSR